MDAMDYGYKTTHLDIELGIVVYTIHNNEFPKRLKYKDE